MGEGSDGVVGDFGYVFDVVFFGVVDPVWFVLGEGLVVVEHSLGAGLVLVVLLEEGEGFVSPAWGEGSVLGFGGFAE